MKDRLLSEHLFKFPTSTEISVPIPEGDEPEENLGPIADQNHIDDDDVGVELPPATNSAAD